MSKEKEKKKYKYYTKALRCPDGTRKYIRGKTKKELDEKVKALEQELAKGVNIKDDTTFGELAQLWLNEFKAPTVRPQTADHIRKILEWYALPILAHLPIRDIKPIHISLVMAGMAQRARSTQKDVLCRIKEIIYLAIENGIISRSPVPPSVKACGETAPQRVPLTPKECSDILQSVRKKDDWFYTFLLIAIYTGMRVGEICGLCWDCVDFEQNVIRVRRQMAHTGEEYIFSENLKTPTSRRDIPAPPQLMDNLKAVKAKTSAFYVLVSRYGTPARPITAYRRLSAIPFPVHLHPHLFRHTYATRLIESGVDIKAAQYLLGHSKPDMLLNIYSHYDRKSREAATARQIENISFTV